MTTLTQEEPLKELEEEQKPEIHVPIWHLVGLTTSNIQNMVKALLDDRDSSTLAIKVTAWLTGTINDMEYVSNAMKQNQNFIGDIIDRGLRMEKGKPREDMLWDSLRELHKAQGWHTNNT